MPDSYRIVDPDTDEVVSRQSQVEIVLAVNRFARAAEATHIDRSKDILDGYEDYSLWDIEVKPAGSTEWNRLLSSFVIEQKWDQSETTAEFLSHDHWLRRRKVYREYDDEDPIDLIEDVINDFTPLTWDPTMVDLVNPPDSITETYKGVTPDTIVADIVAASDQEQYGATNDLEFFIRERDPGDAPFNFTPERYVSTDWDDDKKGEFNQVRLLYGENGDNAVVVDDKEAQLALGESVGSGPIVLERTKTYEGIEDEQTARTKAESILREGDPIQVGTVESWNLGTLRPGMVIVVEDPDADISGEFRIAEVRLNSTGLDSATVAENTEGVLDLIAGLSEEQDRIEARAGTVDPATVEYIPLEVIGEAEYELTIREVAFADFSMRLGFAFPRQDIGVLEVDSGDTYTIEESQTESFTTVKNAGTVKAEGTLKSGGMEIVDTPGGLLGYEFPRKTLDVELGETYTIAANETESYETVNNAGTIKAHGTLKAGETMTADTPGALLGDWLSQRKVVTTA